MTDSAALRDWPCTNPDHLGLCTDGHVHADHQPPSAASLCAEVYDYALGPTVVTCQRPPHDDKHHRASLDDGLNFTTITWTPRD